MAKRWKPNVTVAAVIERDGRFLVSVGEMRVIVNGGSNAHSTDETDAATLRHAKV